MMFTDEKRNSLENSLTHNKLTYYFDAEIKSYTTWKIGGTTPLLIISHSSQELEKALFICQMHHIDCVILGRGSNVLVPSSGLQKVVIVNKSRECRRLQHSLMPYDRSKPQISVFTALDSDYTMEDYILSHNWHSLHENKDITHFTPAVPRNKPQVQARHKEHDLLKFDDLDDDIIDLSTATFSTVLFDSGVDLAYAINWTHSQNLSGLQFFAGIPSTIGGALFNNIHGGSRHFSDVFLCAHALKKVAKPPKLITISGPSGVGKNTLYEYILSQHHDKLAPFATTTTRDRRHDEIDGISRRFITKDEFEAKIKKGDFLEYERLFNGHYYGVDKTEIEAIIDTGKIPIFDIDVKGALKLQHIFGEDIQTIFIAPPSFEILENRLRDRGDHMREDLIQERLSRISYEMSFSHRFDYTVVNDVFEESCQTLEAILFSAYRFSRHYLNINDMKLGYDASLLREDRSYYILQVCLLLPELSEQQVKRSKEIAATWLKRKSIQPRKSCGSVFQSLPEEVAQQAGLQVQAAGYMIDKILNLKGFRVGGAQISPVHANFIVNENEATSEDIRTLVETIKAAAKAKLGVDLHEEFDYLHE